MKALSSFTQGHFLQVGHPGRLKEKQVISDLGEKATAHVGGPRRKLAGKEVGGLGISSPPGSRDECLTPP